MECLAYLSSIDDLVSKAFCDRLHATERSFTGSLADQVDCLVYSTEWRNINGLPTNDTTRADTGGVFTSAGVGNGIDEYLNGVLAGEEVNQFHSLLDNSDSHLLFTVVPSTRGHQHVGETFNEGALDFLEPTLLVAASGVGHKHLLSRRLHLTVSSKRNVTALNTIVRPLSEQFWLKSVFWSFIIALVRFL